MRVSFIATDLVDRALGEAHHVERVKADLGLRDVLSDGLLITAGHVDRDPPDRVCLRSPRRSKNPFKV